LRPNDGSHEGLETRKGIGHWTQNGRNGLLSVEGVDSSIVRQARVGRAERVQPTKGGGYSNGPI
jgi:hypothetical protein